MANRKLCRGFLTWLIFCRHLRDKSKVQIIISRNSFYQALISLSHAHAKTRQMSKMD